MMNMFQSPNFQKDKSGHITMLAPTFFSCGCGGIQARFSSVMVYLPISPRQVNQAKPHNLQIAKDWLKQEGLYDQIPLLKKHSYGVLIDNKLTDGKHEWIDVNQGAATHVAQEFRRILGVPESNK